MNKKTRLEQELAERIKALRNAIRLKHAIAADREINERIPDEVKRFWKAVQLGKAPEPLALGAVFNVEPPAERQPRPRRVA